ncbi:GntR family transcriptional regulator [Arcobacter peruensis]|uniref:GntR family transcriptional regulator n=1 Tax=Arcobacter peruensis TaxID=2320140 RepID=UPI000F08730D|nr:GntR family transcriptional regulator [Arcobacter peruensis]
MFAKNGIPLYLQLKEKILEDIKLNYKVNDIIPTEGKLEEKYKLSRITVRKAIEELEKDNIVIKKQGKGTFVKEQKILYDANSIGSLTQRLSKQKHLLTTKSISFEIIEEREEHFVKDMLSCKKLLCIKRTRLLDEVPFALMFNYFDVNTVPDIDKKMNLESLYAFLKKEYNIEFHNAEEIVEAMIANDDDAKKLNIEKGSPLLSLKRLSYNQKNEPIEYSNLIIRGDMYKHKIILSNDKLSNI